MDKSEVLGRYFPSIEGFRGVQEETIDALVSGQSVLCLMPTGGGKSLIYQVAGLALERCTVVVSPLVALMSQQADQLNRQGVQALNFSGMSSAAQFATITEMAKGRMPDFIFTSPERISNDGFLEYVLSKRADVIGLVVVDEAHCISQWGEGFRPAYRNIPLAISRIFGESWPRVLCLTATLNTRQQDQVREEFRITRTVKSATLWRKNLHLEILDLDEDHVTKDEALERILDRHAGEKILVFVHRKYGNKGTTRTLRDKFQGRYDGVAAFDSDMSDSDKAQVLRGFADGSVRIVFATSAFGMGVDIPDIRVVVNYRISETVEQYYQEVGRAGRDGRDAWGYLLYTRQSRRGRLAVLSRALCSEVTLRDVWDDRRPRRTPYSHLNYDSINDDQRTAFALLVDHGVFTIVSKSVQSIKCFEGVTPSGRTFLARLASVSRTGSVPIIAKKSGDNINSLTLDIWAHCARGDIRLKSAPSKAIYYTQGRELTDELVAEILADQGAKKAARVEAFSRFADGIEQGKSAEQLVREALDIEGEE